MKLSLIILAASFSFLGPSAFAQKNDIGETFIGVIMNRGCVSQQHITTQAEVDEAKACTEQSVNAKPTYVLYDPETKTTYELVDQKKAAEFAGQDVELIGY